MPEIKRYALRIHSGPDGDKNDVRAAIHLFGEDNHLAGVAYFYSAGNPLPDAKNETFIEFGFPISLYSSVLDMLRNENPIYLAWQEARSRAYLGTTQEPVGEGNSGDSGI